MTRPRLLDLFCGAGGAAMGYHRAGFDVVGVDIERQSAYPFEFIQADALAFMDDYFRHDVTRLDDFDAIHASPPCQAYSIATPARLRDAHPDLVDATRKRLGRSGVPWVMENVKGAPMLNPLVLCGTMFDLWATDVSGERLFLRRHRLFESDLLMFLPGPCRCVELKRAGYGIGGVYGGGSQDRARAENTRHGGYTPTPPVQRELMGVPASMPHRKVTQAIPPAYTEWIGAQLLRAVTERVA